MMSTKNFHFKYKDKKKKKRKSKVKDGRLTTVMMTKRRPDNSYQTVRSQRIETIKREKDHITYRNQFKRI